MQNEKQFGRENERETERETPRTEIHLSHLPMLCDVLLTSM